MTLFKIYDGRAFFYQWDVNQKLIIDNDKITQVHFSNLVSNQSLVVDARIEDGLNVVDVPDVLLQQDWPLCVYGYDGVSTEHDEKFEVKSRAKPESYVYTPEDTLNYKDLSNRMDKLEEDVPDIVEGAIKDYMHENPPTVDLTGYATEKYVDDAVSGIKFPEPDLTPYAKTADLAAVATSGNYSDLKNKPTIPSIEGLATESYVEEAINKIELTPGPAGKDGKDGEDYILTEADKQEIAEMVDVPEGGSVAVDGTTIIQNADGTISTAVGGYVIPGGEMFRWEGSLASEASVALDDISIFEDEFAEMDGDEVTISFVLDDEEYEEEYEVSATKREIVFENIKAELTAIVVNLSEETITVEHEGDNLTSLVINSATSYEEINPNFIPVGRGLRRTAAAIAIDATYIEELIADYIDENIANAEEASY